LKNVPHLGPNKEETAENIAFSQELYQKTTGIDHFVNYLSNR
jgi:hypothetical protein